MREGLFLYEAVEGWAGEIERLEGPRKDFKAPYRSEAGAALDTLAQAVRETLSIASLNPHRKKNDRIREENAKGFDALDLTGPERAGVLAVNDYRDLMGLRRLSLDPALVEAARGHSASMEAKGYFSHRSKEPGLTTVYARIRKAGYDYRLAGENIARKIDGLTAQEALATWIESPGHDRNLLHPESEDLGLGVRGIYWTLDMGRKR
jgi:uncharacterized protein YkwD